MNPVNKLLQIFSPIDFALISHGWASHGRDYLFHIQDCLSNNPGEYELCFTHCVRADCETRVKDQVWSQSWGDEFIDSISWNASGQPDGYVWGTNWSNAYPGLTIIEPSTLAKEWALRIGQEFYECTLETDRFFIRIIYHDAFARKLNDNIEQISAVTVPLPQNSQSIS